MITKMQDRGKSYKCNQCDYASAHGNNLRKHLRAHGGEKANKCNQCDFASSRANNLRRHLKTHSGEKMNKCNHCDYASSQVGHLRKHLRIHSGEKSNKCNQCNFACSEPGSLRRRLKRYRPAKRGGGSNKTKENIDTIHSNCEMNINSLHFVREQSILCRESKPYCSWDQYCVC